MASFRVKTSFQLTGTGGVLLGDIVEGTLRIGMQVVSVDGAPMDERLTVSAVEVASHERRTRFSVGLLFEGQPSKEQLDERFGPGALLRLE